MKCIDCGLLLDSFGICPRATAQQARAGRGPVFCGRPLDNHSRLLIEEAAELAERMKTSRLGKTEMPFIAPSGRARFAQHK
jgi:hypothetical protein